MTTRETFFALMAERRLWPKGSADHEYRSRAARQLYWIIKGIPSGEWTE